MSGSENRRDVMMRVLMSKPLANQDMVRQQRAGLNRNSWTAALGWRHTKRWMTGIADTCRKPS